LAVFLPLVKQLCTETAFDTLSFHAFLSLQWQQAKSFFVDNFLEHAKAEGLEDCCWLHLVKESR